MVGTPIVSTIVTGQKQRWLGGGSCSRSASASGRSGSPVSTGMPVENASWQVDGKWRTGKDEAANTYVIEVTV
jgi:hypothetical protein